MRSVLYIFYLNLVFFQIYCQTQDVFLDSERNIQNFFIQISEKISKYDSNLIENIKISMEQASKSLYKATSNLDKSQSGIKFGKIFISVPNQWKTEIKVSQQNVTDKAHFKIVPRKNNNNSDKSWTKQYPKCGKPGKYSKFSAEFFNEKDLLKKGKRIMKEFVKLRYGVFSERPYKNVLFVHNNISLIKGICNQNIKWKVNNSPEKCSDENSVCKYTIDGNQNHNYSIMFDSDSHTSDYFCNDNDRPHNHLAYNLHNIFCNGKSVSSVIMKHQDFNKKSAKSNSYKNPTFQILLQRGRQIVLVLDRSGSMNEFADKVKNVVGKFIMEYVEESAEISIVTYNKGVNVVSPLTSVSSVNTRKYLNDQVKMIKYFGLSKIGKGIKTGMKILLGNSTKTRNDLQTMILITDEQISRDKKFKYSDVIKALKKSNIILHVFSFNNKSDSTLRKLAKSSDGSYARLLGNFSFDKIFMKLLLKNKTKNLNKKIELLLNDKLYKYSYNVTYQNNLTTVNVNIKKNLRKYMVKMSNKSGLDILPVSTNLINKETQLVFEIKGQLKPGKYQLTFIRSGKKSKHHNKPENSELSLKNIQYSIYSENERTNKRRINPIGFISKNFIEEIDSKTFLTVTVDLSECGITNDERINVILEMNLPSDKKVFKILKDDGIGDDSISNDKIYTVNIYPKDLLEKGFYNFIGQVEIMNIKNTKEKIKRTVTFENLRVKDVKNSAWTDKISPAEMVEPKIKIIGRNRIQIKTLATGDDSMDGQIKNYQILARSKEDKTFDVIKSAKPYEEIVFDLDLENLNIASTIKIAVRGIDDNNNEGKWSQFVRINKKS